MIKNQFVEMAHSFELSGTCRAIGVKMPTHLRRGSTFCKTQFKLICD